LGGLEDEEVGLPAVGTDEEEFMYNIEEVMSLSFAFPPSPFFLLAFYLWLCIVEVLPWKIIIWTLIFFLIVL
jgi:hypothetical protein